MDLPVTNVTYLVLFIRKWLFSSRYMNLIRNNLALLEIVSSPACLNILVGESNRIYRPYINLTAFRYTFSSAALCEFVQGNQDIFMYSSTGWTRVA